MRRPVFLILLIVFLAGTVAGGMRMPAQTADTNDDVAASVDRPFKNQMRLAVYQFSHRRSYRCYLFPTKYELMDVDPPQNEVVIGDRSCPTVSRAVFLLVAGVAGLGVILYRKRRVTGTVAGQRTSRSTGRSSTPVPPPARSAGHN